MVDQHAADERVRVERYLRKLCDGFLFNSGRECVEEMQGIVVDQLEPAKPVLLTKHEAHELLVSQPIQRYLFAWGFSFETPKQLDVEEDGDGYTQVLVSTVPQVVAPKVRILCPSVGLSSQILQITADDDLRDLIKETIARHSHDLPVYDCDNPDSWIKALRWMPKQLLDLVNSKACRGAFQYMIGM